MSDPTPAAVRRRLVDLSRGLGDPAADLVVLGEGNTSADLGEGSFWVKASGASLADAAEEHFVRADRAAVLALVDDPGLDDHDQVALGAGLRAATLEGVDGARPSIETMLHALALDLPGVRVVGHTHPTWANGLLCSDRAHELVAGCLFPDQVVVCGPESVLVPYAEPGLPLARAFRDGLRDHVARRGGAPRLVWLGNHGMVALGASERQVHQITVMAVKVARVLAAALAVGSPRHLDAETVRRLADRDDERHRQSVLAGGHPS